MSADHLLHYTTPATSFKDSLPLGNGRLGASVLSSLDSETFIINEISFWSGAPHTAGSGLYTRADDPKAELRETQRRLLDGDFRTAQDRSAKYLASKKHNFGTNLPVGKLDIRIAGAIDDNATGFERELRLDEAISKTEYESNGHFFKRSAFVSHPHQVLAAHFETDSPSGLKLEISVQGENDAFSARSMGDRLHFDAQALEPVHSDGTSGVRGHGIVAVKADNGDVQIECRDAQLIVKVNTSATVLLAFTTDFQHDGNNWKDQTSSRIDGAWKLTFDDLHTAHIADYQPIYRRTSIALGPAATPASGKPTDQRRKSFVASEYGDPGMFALYFHYARYLHIAGTRQTSPLPLHLQGLWNDGEACRMGWSCDYHLDINTQMNYYATFPGALHDQLGPMISYLKALAISGKEAARACYGCDGWVAHVFSNVWGFADPGWETSYGLNVTGGLWMASHLIEMYEYNQDDDFLVETAYPLLKGAAEFFLEYMIEDPKTGWLHTGPSVSPENSFFAKDKDGKKEEHSVCLSPTLDLALVRDLFAFCGYAAKRLNTDDTFAGRVTNAQAKLPPFQVGRLGQFQEWLEDYEEAQPFHRHLSHTMALCRSALVSSRHTPDLAGAIAVTLERRQGRDDLEDIEFTAALFAMNYSRLGDADKALAQIGHLVGELSFDNLLSYSKPGVAGADVNIFVIDGNFGGAAAIVEMLVRSTIPQLGGEVEIDLLPALPEACPEGSVRGVRLRGNLGLDMEWSSGKLTMARITAFSGGALSVYYGLHHRQVVYKPDEVIELGPGLQTTL